MNVLLHKGENCGFVKSDLEAKAALNHPKKPALKKGKSHTVFFANPPKIIGRMSVAGEKEGRGPVGKYFHKIVDDDKMHEKTFEKAEYDMLLAAINGAMESAKVKAGDIDLFIAGDLLNQITSSSYAARELSIPYLGVYSACSTLSESLAIGSAMISAGYYDKIMCATASHFATAERQFRYPLEYGCQRPPYAQWTVTAAGATLLSSEGDGVKITSATFEESSTSVPTILTTWVQAWLLQLWIPCLLFSVTRALDPTNTTLLLPATSGNSVRTFSGILCGKRDMLWGKTI